MTDKQKRQEKKQAPRAGWFGGEILHAIDYGDREAIMISGFLYMIREIWGDDDYLYDGRYYKPITLDGLCRFFPMWSKKTVRTVKDSLITQGVLITHGNNVRASDRTANYAFSDEKKFLNAGFTTQESNAVEPPYVENNTCGAVSESARVQVSESAHLHIYNILDNISYVQNDATTANASVCVSDPVRGEEGTLEKEVVKRKRSPKKKIDYSEQFTEFFNAYPKRLGVNPKEAAQSSYLKALKEHTHEEIMGALKAYERAMEKKGNIGTEFVRQAVGFFFKGFYKEYMPTATRQGMTLENGNQTNNQTQSSPESSFNSLSLEQKVKELERLSMEDPKYKPMLNYYQAELSKRNRTFI